MTKRAPVMPDSVKVGALTYRISCDAMTHINAEEDQSSRLDGSTDHTKGLITFSPRLHDGAARQTLVHELLHCVFSQSGLRPEDEEQICRSLEAGLYAVIRENPDLIAWLTSDG